MVKKNPFIRNIKQAPSKPLDHQSMGILDDYAIRKNIDTKEGTIVKTPVNDIDIANKKYVDDNSGAGTWTDTSTNTGTNKTFDDFTNHIEADEIHEELRNESGAEMTRGDAVYISGFSVGQVRALVSLADSSGAATMPMIAILEDATLANNTTGHFIEIGTLEDVDTNSWNVGDDLYISETGTTTNTLTNTKPTGTALIQKIGVVLRKHASNGVLEIFGAGRENDLPNLPSNNIWLGNGSGVPIENNFDTEVSANSDVTTNSTHSADNTQAHSDYLLNSAADVGVGLSLTGDNASADTTYVPNVLYNTDATPPTASTVPIGTIYVQYTA